jgi:hypothetical protein
VDHLPHRCDAVTDLLDPFETISGAERLARNMGDPPHTYAYTTPGGLRREERRSGVLTVGSDMLTTAMLMTFAIEDILDGQSVVWIGRTARRGRFFITSPGTGSMTSSSFHREARKIARVPPHGTS